jgi:hypothetical protein
MNLRDTKFILKGFNMKLVDGNDHLHYEVYEKQILASLKEVGSYAPVMADVYRTMLTAKVGTISCRIAAVLQQPQYLLGFTRSEVILSHSEQINLGNFDRSKLKMPHLKYIRDSWKDTVMKIYDMNWNHRSSADFLETIPSVLTTKSAGIGNRKVRVYIKGFAPTARKDRTNGKKYFDFSFTDKTMVFMHEPHRYIQKEGYPANSVTNPFYWGSRDVPARATRAISMIGLSNYIREAALIPQAMDVFSTQEKKIIHPFLGSHGATFGKESGIMTKDHAPGIYSSSKKNVLIFEWDFSQFDAFQRKRTRQAVINGLREAKNSLGLSKKEFLGFSTALDMLTYEYG